MSNRRTQSRYAARLSPRRPAGAFSLVEVLIAVLILALGLLGLGAVFPVIVREQKLGNDVIVGTLAGNSARAVLQRLDIKGIAGPTFWADTRGVLVGDDPADSLPFAEGAWLPAEIPPAEVSSGNIIFPNSTVGQLEIPLKMRLYPVDTRSSQPQFVWDIAVQRIADGGGDTPTPTDPGLSNDDLRVAIFVRRIDTRIRVPRSTPLIWALTERDSTSAPEWRVPVAEDANGVPTYDGVGDAGGPPRYSNVRTVRVEFDYNSSGTPDQRRRDRLYAPTSSVENSQEWRLARQPNQKLIDNLGNVYTVLEAGEDGGREFVRISPEVPAYVTTNDRIIQVAFTPQVAAAIVTWRVTP